ncbi:hypothetical protein RRF57_011483 [Xylaria bambusicola]|uniref:Uncharacterized protein n=1 Tax=Xylaria bambusicola TaxID=326684 RepID=A0AAN7UZL4_9PEZI
MDFVYNNGGPQGQFEEELAKHQRWRWMRTNTIDATQHRGSLHSMAQPSSGNPDRLGKHSHHGNSTHLVVKGDLRVKKHHGDRSTYELSDWPGAQRQDLVKPNLPYSATSTRGCTFVEAHESLSPQSAERFITRGTLRLEKKPGARWAYPSDDDLKRWLTQPILDASHVYPPIPEDFFTALSEWLEQEWQKPSWWKRNLWTVIWLVVVVALAFYFYYLGKFIAVLSRM